MNLRIDELLIVARRWLSEIVGEHSICASLEILGLANTALIFKSVVTGIPRARTAERLLEVL
jgi:hypothetical protein